MNHYILGIQSYASHDTGACIIKYNKKTPPEYIAISEERLIRKKYPYTFPIHSILYCMNYFGLKKISQIDFIVSDWIRVKKWNRSGPSYNYQMFDYIKEKLNYKESKIYQINHHLAHAASAFHSSNFKKSAILIVDGNGSDVETTSYFYGINNKINFLENYKYQGIGSAYTAVTNQILNFGTGGEGKTMGLAPYGNKNINININCSLNGIKNNFMNFMLRMPFSDVLNQIHNNYRVNPLRKKIKPANKKNILNKLYKDWSYAIQKISEKVLVHLGKDIYKKTLTPNICLAGGVALNSVANEKLFKSTLFKDIFIFPACSDAGLPFGLASWGYFNIAKQNKKIVFNNAYTGKNYLVEETIELLKKNKIEFKQVTNKEIANLISKGNIIGHFDGASEYGPRALGNRSILADARNPKIRDYINLKVKHREIFRPFAPAILEEKSKEYFDINYSPYMLRVAKCFKKKLIPSAIHVDNTARVQTVNQSQNKKFYSIIKEFYNITNVPVVLNTSFNDAGEPLVETPLDALICFFNTKIDFLVLHNLLIDASQYNTTDKKKILKSLNQIRLELINKNEKIALKVLTKGLNLKQYKKRKKIENIKASEYLLNRSLEKIKIFFDKINKNEKILIIGTNDHTYVLTKLFNKIISKNIHFDYYEYNFNDVYKTKYKINYFNKVKSIKLDKYQKVFISSYQYLYEIKEKLRDLRVIEKNIFSPYDNSSRSIIDYYFIKKYKSKFPIFSKKI